MTIDNCNDEVHCVYDCPRWTSPIRSDRNFVRVFAGVWDGVDRG